MEDKAYYQQNQADGSDTIALMIEIVFGIFGILGLGWLYARNIPMAVLAFIGFTIFLFVEALIAMVTFGLSLCLSVPLHFVIVIISGVRARDHVRNTGVSGSIVHLLVGLLLGSIVLCVGIALLVIIASAGLIALGG